jgi:hypothetical protein
MGGVNDGTQWSNGGVGDSNWDSSFPIQRGFNGEAAYGTGNFNMARPNNANVTATWNAPGSGIPFTTLKLTAARDSGSYSNAIKINGVDVTSQFTASTSTLATVTITGVSSPLTKLELTAQSGVAQPRFTAIYIDDVILTDPVTFEGNASATNFNPFTTDIKTVRGQETGYCTINPLHQNASNITLSEGNLRAKLTGGSNWWTVGSTIAVNSGKYYFEVDVLGGQYHMVGITSVRSTLASGDSVGSVNGGVGYFSDNGNKYVNSSNSSYGSTYTTGDTIGCAFNIDDLSVTFYKNGISQGAISNSIISGNEYTPVASLNDQGTGDGEERYNFGQKPFKFPPPAGFQPLNAANVRPSTVIARPDQYVGIVTYTGSTGAGTIKDNNINFTPDFVWLKSRSNGEGHALYDTVRGSTGGNFYRLRSDSTAAQNSPTNELSSMIRGGFTVNNNGHCYFNGYTYVAWTWKAGGNSNTYNIDDVGYASAAAAGLDGGSATVTGASINTKSDFSIIQFHTAGTNSGATIPHGLSKAPDFIVAKSLGVGVGWKIYHSGLGNDYFLEFDTDAQFNVSNYWGVTSSVFEADASGDLDFASPGCISYCWANKPGLQKFGSYIAGSEPFVELGFKPAIVMIKCIGPRDTAFTSWYIADKERSQFNPSRNPLWANKSASEGKRGDGSTSITNPAMDIDLLSNGFKIKDNGDQGDEFNYGGSTYIYAAWAEAPSFNLYGAQSNAR